MPPAAPLLIDELLPEKEVTRRLGMTLPTLWKYRHGKGGRRRLRSYKIGCRVYYHPRDLDEFVLKTRG